MSADNKVNRFEGMTVPHSPFGEEYDFEPLPPIPGAITYEEALLESRRLRDAIGQSNTRITALQIARAIGDPRLAWYAWKEKQENGRLISSVPNEVIEDSKERHRADLD